MKIAFLTTAAFLASAAVASAQTFTEKVIEKLQEQGFDVTEVENGNGLIRVEATRNGKDRELIYDAQTGALLKDEYDGDDQIGDDQGDDENDDDSGDDDDGDDGDDESDDDDGDDGDDESDDDDGDDDSSDDDSSDDSDDDD